MGFIVKSDYQGHEYSFDFVISGYIIGSAKIIKNLEFSNKFSNKTGKQIFVLENFKIKEDFQNKKYGTAFLNDLKYYIRHLKASLIVDVVPTNMTEDMLIRFYEKNGFICRDDFFIDNSIITLSQNEKCALIYN